MLKKVGNQYQIKILIILLFLLSACAPEQKVNLSYKTPKSQIPLITNMKIKVQKDKIRWQVVATQPFAYTLYELLNPSRLVLEISGARIDPTIRSKNLNNWGIKTIVIHSMASDNIVKFIAYLTKPLRRNVFPQNNGLVIELTPLKPASISVPPGLIKYKPLPQPIPKKEETKRDEYPQDLISIDFDQADLRSVLRWMAKEAGLNVVFGKKVKGKICIHLNNVPWNEAFRSILVSHELVASKMGNLIRIVTNETYEKEKKKELALRRIEAQVKKMELEEKEQAAKLSLEVETKLKKAQKIAQPLITWVQPVKYLDAEELKKNLEPFLSKDLDGKPYGFIQVNKDKNALIICDVKQNISQIVQIIRQLDVKIPQVVIEARIAEISTDSERELGIQWGTNAQIGSVGISGAANGNIVNLPISTQNNPTGGLDLSFTKLTGNTFNIDAKLLALESQGKVKILSSPRIATMDNKEAVIESGRRIPYQELTPLPGTTEAYPTLSWIDALLELKIKPHIISENLIKMDILASKEEADFTKTVLGAPTIVKKKAATTLLVRNGETVVIGGLYKENQNKEKRGVPWLEKIPLLGYFFKGEHQSKTNEELLIFITPRILED